MQASIGEMDLTKLSGSSFNESGLFGGEKQPEESSIERLADTNERKLTSSVGDLLNATRSRHGRQYTESRYMSQSASMSMLQDTGMSGLPNSKMNKKGGKDKMNGSQREKAGNANLTSMSMRDQQIEGYCQVGTRIRGESGGYCVGACEYG